MENYLLEFIKNQKFKQIEGLIPSGICPYLFYNLSPYIYTLANNGWFSWTKRLKDTSYRKAINENDFKRKDVNRLYPNEVLVRCPNPHVIVVAGIGFWPGDKIKIRILYSNGVCSNNHKLGNEILLNINESRIKTLKFNELFPETLSLCLTGRSLVEGIGEFKWSSAAIMSVSKIIFPCRYHKRKVDFRFDSLLPENFNPHLFWLIYPQVLAVMYGALIDTTLRIKYFGKDSYIIVSLEKVYNVKNRIVKLILNSLKNIFETLFYPIDLLDYKLEITIIENESNVCSLEKGKKYLVNMSNGNFLCPAAFHAVYPYLMLFAYGYKMQWDGNGTSNLLTCPDCIGSIYSIN